MAGRFSTAAGQAEDLGLASGHSKVVDPQVHAGPCIRRGLNREGLQAPEDVLALERGPVSVAHGQGWVPPAPPWCLLQEKQDGPNGRDRNNAAAGSNIPRPKKAR